MSCAPKYACRTTVRCWRRRSGAPDWLARPWQVSSTGFGFASKNGEEWAVAELHRVQGNLLAAEGKAEPACTPQMGGRWDYAFGLCDP